MRRLALIHDVDGPVAGCATTICHIATLDLVDAAGSGAAETIATATGSRSSSSGRRTVASCSTALSSEASGACS